MQLIRPEKEWRYFRT